MVDIFWDGFDKYGPLNCMPTNSTMGSEWTTLPSSASIVRRRALHKQPCAEIT